MSQTEATSTKWVLITGCSSGGIGHALAREYQSKGLSVIATARRLESMEDLSRLGIITMALDVTDISAIREVRDNVAALTGGRLDILVNNACVYPAPGFASSTLDMDLEGARQVFEVNVWAPVRMVQEFSQMLIASGDGRILQIGSTAALLGVPFAAAYNASKAAFHSFTNTLRVELAPFNIKVIGVISGSVKTNIIKPRNLPDNSLYKSMEDVFHQKRINVSHARSIGSMTPEEYSITVAAETLKTHPRAWIWAGNTIWLPWFVDTFIGSAGFDWIMNKRFSLSDFSAKVQRGEVKVKRD
ncbi:NAD-P-binding protein [Amylostereum chailletii]|nr:NAD-P-binding protein [Amylostereum chailletii]